MYLIFFHIPPVAAPKTRYIDNGEISKCMLPEEPESSRFLEGLKRRREQSLQLQANALSFSSYGKGEADHV